MAFIYMFIYMISVGYRGPTLYQISHQIQMLFSKEHPMLSEPYKIKEVKHLPFLEPYQRWNILKHAGFNTFRIPSDHVTFDLVARGMSSWTHFQKAAYMVGDEAYAGSRNYARLEKATQETFGLKRIVPTHNGIGAEKLVVKTLLNKGQMVLHNRGPIGGLVEGNGGLPVDVTCGEATKHDPPECFGANVDMEKLEHLLKEKGPEIVAYGPEFKGHLPFIVVDPDRSYRSMIRRLRDQ